MNRRDIPQMAAAGGLVLCRGQVLLIRKHGLWDIPKGKIKANEPAERCALREISEETGLSRQRLTIRHPLCKTSYISYYSGQPFNKTVNWFLLDYSGQLTDPLRPDLAEDIDLCQWADVDQLLGLLDAGRPYLRAVRSRIADSIHLLRQHEIENGVGDVAS